jgi:hypothetical protein
VTRLPRPRIRHLTAGPTVARFVVWALVAVVVGASLTLPDPSVPAQTPPVSAASTVATHTVEVVHLHGPPGPGTGPAPGAQWASGDGAPLPASVDRAHRRDPKGLLPAYRWNDGWELHSETGFMDLSRTPLNTLAGVGFVVAGTIWGLTTAMINMAMTADYLSAATDLVDQAFARLSTGLIGVMGVVWLVVLVKAGRLSLRGDLIGLLRSVAVFVLPVSMMFYLAGNAQNYAAMSARFDSTYFATAAAAEAAAARVRDAQTGTPSWLALEGTRIVNVLGESVGSGFHIVDTGDGTSPLGAQEEVRQPNCVGYIDQLYAHYRYYGTVGSGTASPAVAQVSRMWELSMYQVWAQAAFGLGPERHLAACHLKEELARTPVDERQELMRRAFPSLGTPHPAVFATQDTQRKFGSEDEERKFRMFNWMACEWNGGWRVHDHWAKVGRDNPPGNDPNYCTNRWSSGHAELDKQLGTIRHGHVLVATTSHGVDSAEARSAIDSYIGRNAGERLTLAFTATLTAGAYLIALGGVSLGALIAQFGLIVMLIFLPVTLLFMAAGSPTGGRMLKMTIMLIASKFVFTVLVTVIVTLTAVGVGLFSGTAASTSAGGGSLMRSAGLIDNLMVGLMPLVALFVIGQLTKRLGLGNILSPLGAVSFLSGAAAKAGGNQSMREFAGLRSKASAKAKSAMSGAGEAAYQAMPTRFKLRHDARELARMRKLNAPDKAGVKAVTDSELAAAEARFARKKAESKADTRARLGKGGVGITTALAFGGATALTGGVTVPLVAAGGVLAGVKLRRRADARNRSRDGEPETPDTSFAEELRLPSTVTSPQDALAAKEARNRELLSRTDGQTPTERRKTIDNWTLGELADLGAAVSGNVDGRPLAANQLRPIAAAAAAQWGVSADQVIVDHWGTPVLDRTAFGSLADVPVALRGRPELWLDPSVTEVHGVESDFDRASRITGTLIASGHLYASDGKAFVVDHLAQHGVDAASRAADQLVAQLEAGLAAIPAVALNHTLDRSIAANLTALTAIDAPANMEYVRIAAADGVRAHQEASARVAQAVEASASAMANSSNSLDDVCARLRTALADDVYLRAAPDLYRRADIEDAEAFASTLDERVSRIQSSFDARVESCENREQLAQLLEQVMDEMERNRVAADGALEDVRDVVERVTRRLTPAERAHAARFRRPSADGRSMT